MIYKTKHFQLNNADLSVKNSKGESIKLYNKDYEVLLFLSQQKRATSPSEIIERVWDRNEEYSSNVVASSIANIRKQLGKDTIKTVRNCYLVDGIYEYGENSPKNLIDSFFFKKIPLISASFIVILIGGFFLYTQYSTSNKVIVSSLHINPNGNDNQRLDDEWVVLKNNTSNEIDMKGWSVSDEVGHTYIFTTRKLKPYQEIKLVTGKCQNTETNECWNFVDYSIWNNDKDTIYIHNADKRLIYQYTYNFK